MTERSLTHIMPVKGPEAILPADRTPEDVASLLRRPFAASAIRSRGIAGGKSVNYVPVDVILDRLSKAALCWDWTVVRTEIITLPIKRNGTTEPTPVAHVTGRMSIPGLGYRESVGVAVCDGDSEAVKKAESFAIRRCAGKFGVPVSGGKA